MYRVVAQRSVDTQACCAHPFDERPEVGQRGSRQIVLTVAELAEEHSHVPESVTSGCRDGGEGVVHCARVDGAHVSSPVGLRDHHGQRMGDDVVHVAGDSVAFLFDDDVVLCLGLFELGELARVP